MISKRNDPISQSMMLLCLGTASLLIASQWQKTPSLKNQTQPVFSQPPASPAVETVQQPLSFRPVPEKASSLAPFSNPSASSSHLIVDLSDRRVYLYQDKRLQVSYPLGIGQVGWETPTGTFQVIQMRRNPSWKHPITGAIVPSGPQNPLGKRWIGFWTDGHSLIGFHGTNQENSVGQAISHGCLRMRNQDIIALYDRISEGTPVTVRP